MSTFGLTWNLKSPDRNKQFISNIPRMFKPTDCDICLTTSNKWVQKIKGQFINRSTFLMIQYMNGSVFSKARYMNGVGFWNTGLHMYHNYPQVTAPPPPAPPLPRASLTVHCSCIGDFILPFCRERGLWRLATDQLKYISKHKRTMMVLYRSPEQTDLHT